MRMAVVHQDETTYLSCGSLSRLKTPEYDSVFWKHTELPNNIEAMGLANLAMELTTTANGKTRT